VGGVRGADGLPQIQLLDDPTVIQAFAQQLLRAADLWGFADTDPA
jgi:hypothetical protein